MLHQFNGCISRVDPDLHDPCVCCGKIGTRPRPTTRNGRKLFLGELVALRLDESQHLLGGLARLRLLAQLGAEVHNVDLHNMPFSRRIDARLRNRAEPISILYAMNGTPSRNLDDFRTSQSISRFSTTISKRKGRLVARHPSGRLMLDGAALLLLWRLT